MGGASADVDGVGVGDLWSGAGGMRKEIQGQSAGVLRARGGGLGGDAAVRNEFAKRGHVASRELAVDYSRSVMRDFICGIEMAGDCRGRWRGADERRGRFFLPGGEVG